MILSPSASVGSSAIRGVRSEDAWRSAGRPVGKTTKSKCHYCGIAGHWKISCTIDIVCFACRRRVHVARLCPFRDSLNGTNTVSRSTTSRGWVFEGSQQASAAGRIIGRQEELGSSSDEGGHDDLVVGVTLIGEMIGASLKGEASLCEFSWNQQRRLMTGELRLLTQPAGGRWLNPRSLEV